MIPSEEAGEEIAKPKRGRQARGEIPAGLPFSRPPAAPAG